MRALCSLAVAPSGGQTAEKTSKWQTWSHTQLYFLVSYQTLNLYL